MTTREPITWTYEPIDPSDLSALDLRAEAADLIRDGETITCYRIHRTDSPTSADAVMTTFGRVGIAWGATADWADYADIEQAIEDWVNHPDAYEARN